MKIRRLACSLALLFAALLVAAASAAQPDIAPAPSPPAASSPPTSQPAAQSAAPSSHPADLSLHVLTGKLEERLKEAEEKQVEAGKQLDELRSTADHIKIVGLVAVPFLLALGGFAFWKLKNDLKERGLQALVEAAVDKLLTHDKARMTRLFEEYRKTIVRVVMAKHRPVLLLGGGDDRSTVERMLGELGYTKLVDKVADADLVMVIGEDACKREPSALAKEILDHGKLDKAVVLFTPTTLDRKLTEELSRVAIVTFANFPATAVNHLVTLGMTTQRVDD
jgi:hypothetical protein